MRLRPPSPGPNVFSAGAGIDVVEFVVTFSRKQIIARLLLIGLAGMAAFAIVQILKAETPLMISIGLLLCALAPMTFVLFPPRTDQKQHPVIISALIGLGCVMIMIGIQRFGASHQPMLGLAVAVLVIWMIFQKTIWRA
jgi:hypothetical protein